VCCLKEGMANLVLVEPGVIGNKAEQRFSDAHKWANAEPDRGVSAYNNFKTVEEDGVKKFELLVISPEAAEHRNIPLKDLSA